MMIGKDDDLRNYRVSAPPDWGLALTISYCYIKDLVVRTVVLGKTRTGLTPLGFFEGVFPTYYAPEQENKISCLLTCPCPPPDCFKPLSLPLVPTVRIL